MADISSEQLRAYRQTARKRWQRVQQQQLARRKQAMALAQQAAQLLKEQYHVRQVLLFGSLAHPERRFSLQSDVDLAVWGLTSANWLQASAAVRQLSREIDVQLVDVDCASAELLAAIKQEGIPL